MTPEELNRTIEFLVRHQAQFSVDLQRDHEMLNRGFVEMHKGFADLRKEMRKGFAEMRKDRDQLRHEMRGDLAKMRDEMRKDRTEWRDEMHKGFAEMRKDRDELRKDIDALQKSMKKIAGLTMEMALNNRRVAELIEIESQRLDGHEKWQQEFQRETTARLDRILDKLTGNDRKPN